MVDMFCALDFVVFYMFFEGVLIPMYRIIGVWGGPRRVYAAIKFVLYTLTVSPSFRASELPPLPIRLTQTPTRASTSIP